MRPLGKLMKPLSIFKNGSHIFINGPVKCKMFCQRNYKPEKKKKPAIHFGDTKGEKKYNYCLNFIIRHIANFFQMAFSPKFSLSQSFFFFPVYHGALLPFFIGLDSGEDPGVINCLDPSQPPPLMAGATLASPVISLSLGFLTCEMG